LNGNRRVTGILRGFDQFMNLVLEDCVEEVSEKERNQIGMVVRVVLLSFIVCSIE
jgi:small nuclear ribonucleoprotein G